jgi:hypothetical protein
MSPSTQGTPAEGGRGQGNALVVTADASSLVDASTGELVDDLTGYDVDELADVFVRVRELKSQAERARKALDEELRRRVAERGERTGRVWVAGDYELKLEHARSWDADELEGVLRALLDDGELMPQDVLGVIEHKAKVNGTAAARLLDRLDGDAAAAVRACHTWRAKGLSVERSLPLLPEQSEDA